jgi:hypothetical protein
LILSMRNVLIACLLCLSCGDDSTAPPGNPDAPVDGTGGSGGMSGIDGGGGAGGVAGMPGDGGPDGPYVPNCGNPPCGTINANSTCVDPDGPGPMAPFCGCANDAFCQNTGHCEMTGINTGRCRCGNGPPCVGGLTICVNNQCTNITDAGTR